MESHREEVQQGKEEKEKENEEGGQQENSLEDEIYASAASDKASTTLAPHVPSPSRREARRHHHKDNATNHRLSSSASSPPQQSPHFRFMERHQHAMETTTTGTTTALVGDPWRWPVVILFSLFSSSNAIQWITYSTIATPARQYFNLSTNQLNMLSSIYMIIFVVGAYFACTTFERFGVRLAVLLGGALNMLGALLKFAPGLQKPSYGIVMLAQVFNACAQLFVLEVPPLIAAQYFPPRKRAFATAIMASANNLGNAAALIIPPFIVKADDNDRVKQQHEFYILFGLELAYCGTIFIASIFFLRSPRSQQRGQPRRSKKQDGEGTAATAAEGGDEDAEELGERVRHKKLTTEQVVSGGGGGGGEGVEVEPTHAAQDTKSSSTRRQQEEEAGEEGSGHPPPTCASTHGVRSQQKTTTTTTTAAEEEKNSSTAIAPKSKMKRAWYRARQNKNVAAYIHVARTIIQLLSQKDFVFLLCAFSVSMGSVWTYASVVGQILDPFGLSAELAGIAGALNLVAGTVAAYIVGLFVGYKRFYKIPVIICLVGSVLFCLALIIIMKTAKPYTSLMSGMCVFIYIFAGVFQNTAMPIAFEFAMEMTYPLPESVPSALFMAGANLVALIMLSISSAMLGDTPSQASCVYVIVLITCVCAAGAVLSIFPRETLYRHEAEAYAREMRLKEELLSLTAASHENQNDEKEEQYSDLADLLVEEGEERKRGAGETMSESALKKKRLVLSGKE